MQEFMRTYKENLVEIENFLVETIYNLGDLKLKEDDDFNQLYKVFPSLELVYVCDKKNLNQISDNIYRNKTSDKPKGRSREYLLEKIEFDSSNIAISKPYISSATGETCVTVAKEENDNIYFLDFNLVELLHRLGLIEIHKEFNLLTKIFYFITAIVMVLLALFAVGYSLIDFTSSIFLSDKISIESIFKPIIALTLGLAIFDLAKTILDQEVLFKSYSKKSDAEYKVLTKFSITIIIALLIESLLVVFKIAIADYSQMIHAVYLIGGVSILFVALGLFIYFTKKSSIIQSTKSN